MCGIAALFSFGGRIAPEDLTAMTRVARHRGPDGEGYVLFEGTNYEPASLGGRDTPSAVHEAGLVYSPSGSIDVSRERTGTLAALGHRRLAIVDLSAAGHQPMCTPDRRFWITYNGEIYNHLELRAELQRAGETFHSHTDTEVLLVAYRRWGEECLSRLNGMFAFVIVDRATRTVFAARDRFGVKPLYYWSSPAGLLAFASEFKQFSKLPGWRAVLNGQRAYDFLNWGVFDHTRETLFAGVHQLRGGECAGGAIDALSQGLSVRRWYELTPANTAESNKSAATQLHDLLEDSVRLRLRADVSVGSCLSGGLDSSSIVCLASRLLRAAGASSTQMTFSSRSTDPRFDEGAFIEDVVRATGVANDQVYPTPDRLFELLPSIVWHQDEPFGSTSIYAQWHVFQLAARRRIKVMLDGQGADEQLAGYHSFYAAHFAGLARRIRLARLWHEAMAARRLHRFGALRLAGYAVGMLLPERLRQPLMRVAGRPAAARGPWMDMERMGARPADPFLECGGKVPGIAAMSRSQILHTSLPMLLHWEDRDSMAHSVEARVPFLDYRLVEHSLGLPDEAKIRDGVTKAVLREAMREVLPESVRIRTDKIGFATAEEKWLRNERPDAFRIALRQAVDASHGVLRREALDLLEEVIEGKRAFSFLPWRLISFGAWMSCFDVQLGASR